MTDKSKDSGSDVLKISVFSICHNCSNGLCIYVVPTRKNKSKVSIRERSVCLPSNMLHSLCLTNLPPADSKHCKDALHGEHTHNNCTVMATACLIS